MKPPVPDGPITLVLPEVAGGGLDRTVIGLARGLTGHGAEVHLILTNGTSPRMAEIPDHLEVIDLAAERARHAVAPLRTYIETARPALVHAVQLGPNLAALVSALLARRQPATSIAEHSVLSVQLARIEGPRRAFLRVVVKALYPRADHVLGLSPGVADDLATTTGLDRGRVAVLPTPVVAPELFEEAAEPCDDPWFARDAPPLVLGVGRMTRQKDFPTLIRAVAILRERVPARLVILGEGPDRPMLEDLIDELGLREVVRLPGFVPNPYPYMRATPVVAVSSLYEGVCRVITEALALGTPVVSTDWSGDPARIYGRALGRLVPPGDAAALAERIGEVLTGSAPDPPGFAWERFTIETAAAHYLDHWFGRSGVSGRDAMPAGRSTIGHGA